MVPTADDHGKGEEIRYYPYQESIPLDSAGRGDESAVEASKVHYIPFESSKTSELKKQSLEIPVVNKVKEIVSSSKTSLPNPAIVIIGCSRYSNIMNSVHAVLKLKGVEYYRVYVSLGCPAQLKQNVANIFTSSCSSCSQLCRRK